MRIWIGPITGLLASLAMGWCASWGSAAEVTLPVKFSGGHETDRLTALARELGGLGARVSEEADGLRIEPAPMHGGVFKTYADHRMVMAGAVLGLVVPGVVLDDVATVAKTYPDFAGDWAALVAGSAG